MPAAVAILSLMIGTAVLCVCAWAAWRVWRHYKGRK